jgi:hypothetical protein
MFLVHFTHAPSDFPRAVRPSIINAPMWEIIRTSDFFDREEDREPWADTVS